SKGGVDATGSCPSPEIARLGSSPNKPAKISTAKGLTERKSMSRSRSLHSKPKSRFGEQSLPIDPNMFDDISLPRLEELRETSVSPLRNTSNRSSPHNKVTSKERTPKTPLMMPSSQGVGAEDEEICKKVSLGKELKYKRVKMKVAMEWIVFLGVTGIKESIFHQYILRTLSGPPLLGRTNTASQVSVRQRQKKGKGKREIDMNKLLEMKREKVSAWTMEMLVDVISNSGLSTISNALEEIDDGEGERKDKEITSEMESHATAIDIFRNLVQPNYDCDISENALRRFMLQEEVDLVLPLIDVADKGRIDKIALMAWVVKVYKERKALAHALNDTRTAVKQLNKLVTGILIAVIVIVWLLLTGIATTKVLVLLSSQLVVAAFMFGNTCKDIFEAVIFVFVMHPFDVGDRCVIDGTQMIVEEMNILTTVFLKLDNEKIYYPNSHKAVLGMNNFNAKKIVRGAKIFYRKFGVKVSDKLIYGRPALRLMRNSHLQPMRLTFGGGRVRSQEVEASKPAPAGETPAGESLAGEASAGSAQGGDWTENFGIGWTNFGIAGMKNRGEEGGTKQDQGSSTKEKGGATPGEESEE
ncbi:hypothetical protein RJ640_018776, partial [Escallonia rubra]